MIPDKSRQRSEELGNNVWPLPDTEPKSIHNTSSRHFPLTDVLIDVAICEKLPSEVVRWYDYALKNQSKNDISWHYRTLN